MFLCKETKLFILSFLFLLFIHAASIPRSDDPNQICNRIRTEYQAFDQVVSNAFDLQEHSKVDILYMQVQNCVVSNDTQTCYYSVAGQGGVTITWNAAKLACKTYDNADLAV